MELKMIIHAFLLILLSKNISGLEKGTDSPVVEVEQGKLRGTVDISNNGKEFFSYLGIPFAKPPVGKLRFEPPVKADKWDGILESKTMPEACIQMDMINVIARNPVVTGQEDCLYLNVFTPKLDSNLPVMVYIHGGGYICGAASIYAPYNLLNEDIVLVVIQYRLGVFGFLSTEDSSLPGNMALKDQRMALEWARKNIRRFGGDPDNVTIFGESAGGAFVQLHMLSPGSKGLFHRVISQSGSTICPWSISHQHRTYAQNLGKELGCSLDDDSDSFKECLKKIDGPSIVHGMNSQYKWGAIPLDTAPRVDGDFLPAEPATLLKTGKYHKVNLMAGITRDEGAFFTMFLYLNPLMKKALVDEFDTYAPYTIGVEGEKFAQNISKIAYDFYLKGKKIDADPVDELSEIFGDCYMKMCFDISSNIFAKDHDIQLYLYELNHRSQRSLLDIIDVGLPKHYVSHGDDLFYLFSGGTTFALPFERDEDLELRRKITKLWTNFATFGNPTPNESFGFKWNSATETSNKHLSITTEPKMENNSRKEALNLWSNFNILSNRLLSRFGEKTLISDMKKQEL